MHTVRGPALKADAVVDHGERLASFPRMSLWVLRRSFYLKEAFT
jgi:hypothetical protein